MQHQLRAIVAGIENREVSELLCGVFSDLNRLLGYLDGVGTTVRLRGPADEALFLLDVVRSEGLATACGLDSSCAGLELPGDLSEELERTGFALRHELRTVFERSLPGLEDAEGRAETHSRLKDAHDLLRNCFQQSTINLARLFEPGLDGAQLFKDIRAKRDNSLMLYEDLGALLRSARHALWRSDPASQWLFAERLEDFREGSMQYLMQKDSDACLSFVEDFKAAQRFGGARLFLHRFSCYLELLLKHVGMRSVLAEVPRAVAA
ncbi:MAG: hypothetical protein DMF67_09425 [Acidobacteria bacterium]|nr:MAG: hypothetical protein DMF66_12020 [Acidobacteriota bacterium]PYS83353.1 MAG: hypothetical protein DMF67_09425 [Acidobacteriota bacterium]